MNNDCQDSSLVMKSTFFWKKLTFPQILSNASHEEKTCFVVWNTLALHNIHVLTLLQNVGAVH